MAERRASAPNQVSRGTPSAEAGPPSARAGRKCATEQRAPELPWSTYRLQFNPGFTLADARRLIPFLRQLGISHLYASPLLKARAGSMHGYDVVDPTQINPEIGSERDFDELARELHAHDMGLLLDIVPNHMAASSQNPWWVDVLENGPQSPYANWFDIDWQPPSRALQNKVLLPVLGCSYGRLMGSNELTLGIQPNGFFLHYYETELPLAPRSWRRIFALALNQDNGGSETASQSIEHLRALAGEVEQLPTALDAPTTEALKQRLWRLYSDDSEVHRVIDRAIATFNDPRKRGRGPLRSLLSEQAYVLCFWRTANYEINYRRFFAVSELVGIRVEVPEVFEATHRLPLRWMHESKVQGLRIDHIDGLYDPRGYLRQLQKRCAAPGQRDFIVVEKILTGDEPLLRQWPVTGTTGYEFLNALNGIFVEPRGALELQHIYARFLRRSEVACDTIAYEKKRHVIATHFLGEMNALTLHLTQLAAGQPATRRLRQADLGGALVEVIACFPVYRTYIRGLQVAERDRTVIESAVEQAGQRNPKLARRALAFIRQTLLLEGLDKRRAEERDERLRFVMRWQQFTGPIMAKGVEDTAFYIYNPLISANDVGGDPANLSLPLPAFHARMRQAQKHWPATLNATSTHDTKRSEDVRARINVLSEIPSEWAERLHRWAAWNVRLKKKVKGSVVPERNVEIHLYQTLIGAWPLDASGMRHFVERIRNYMLKAAREAKVQTRWVRPNPEYEAALADFVSALLQDEPGNRFFADVRDFAARIAPFGAINGLAQVLIKAAAPGTPDFYQGTETWNLRLVDPDNREPVDFRHHRQLMRKLESHTAGGARFAARDLLRTWRDGLVKLLITSRALALRRARPQAFSGDYLPLRIEGSRRDNVCAFARCHGTAWVVVAVPRFSTQVLAFDGDRLVRQNWDDTAVRLPKAAPGRFRNVLTDEIIEPVAAAEGRLSLTSLFDGFPFALLSGA